MEDPKQYGCGECGVPVEDNEYIVNWGYCAPCLDSSFSKYLRKQRIQYVLRKASAWILAAVVATALFAGAGKVIGIVLYRLSQVN